MTLLIGREAAERRATDDGEVVREVQRLARDLLPQCRILADTVTAWVLEAVPGVAPDGDATAVSFVRESTEQNIGAILAMLAFGAIPAELEPPPGTLKVVRQTVAAGGDLTTVLRAYHVGHAAVSRLWLEHVGQRIDTPAKLPEVVAYASERMFTYFDAACEHLRLHCQTEHGGGAVLGPGTRRAVVDAVLAGGELDRAAAEMVLGYDLQQHHVGLVVAPNATEADARAAIDRVVAVLGPAHVLSQPVGDGTWWAWLGWPEPPSDACLASASSAAVGAVIVGVGEPGYGSDGFRQTSEQAHEAQRTARLSPTGRSGVIRQREVELASLLCSDATRARRLAVDRLGRLADRNPVGERLRHTLRAYLAAGRNRARTAQVLHVHQKTVTYRIAQAEGLLGRSVAADTADLEAALLIDLTLYGP